MVNIETRKYIRYYFSPWYENKWEDVDVEDWRGSRMGLSVQGECVGYRDFVRQECVAEDGEVLKGEPRYVSGMYFIGGNGVRVIDDIEDMRENMFELQAFARHIMNKIGCKKVIVTRSGDLFPFRGEDVIER